MAKREVAIILGDVDKGNAVVSQIESACDNIKFSIYPDFSTFIKVARQQKRVFEKIMITPKGITDIKSDLQEMLYYTTNEQGTTSIVLIASGADIATVNEFKRVLSSPKYLVVVNDKPTVTLLSTIASGKIQDLQEKFNEAEAPQQVEVQSQPQRVGTAQEVPSRKEKKRKRGLFSRFKKGTEEEENTAVPLTNQAVPQSVPENVIQSMPQISGNDLSLGSFMDMHADSGFISEEAAFATMVPQIEPKKEEVIPKVEEKPEVKPEPKVEVEPKISNDTLMSKLNDDISNKEEEELVKTSGQESVLVVGANTNIFKLRAGTIVDLDFEYKPLSSQLHAKEIYDTIDGYADFKKGKTRYITEGYSGMSEDLRRNKLKSLIREGDIIVNASISSLDSIVSVLPLFDRVVINAKDSVKVLEDLDDLSKVSNSTLVELSKCNPKLISSFEVLSAHELW